MRAYVFTDERLRRDAGRFVWLANNTENSKNASFSKRYPVPALPSFFVIDPTSERVLVRWVGGMTVTQLEGVLADAEVAFKGGASGQGPEAPLARADRFYGEGKQAEAARAYREALALAPEGWPSWPFFTLAVLRSVPPAGYSLARYWARASRRRLFSP